MRKCPNCGKEYEGKFCPECGTPWQEEKKCPQCGTVLSVSAKFCPECGYSFTQEKCAEQNKSGFKQKLESAWSWIKSHLKIVIPVAIAVLLVIILSCSIPACVKAKDNGTYYKLGYNGEPEKETYFIIKSGKWTDEDGESGTYKKNGENVVFYYTFMGETEELCTGTLKDGVLKVNDEAYISQKHKHKYGEWEITRKATCTLDGLETRTCACGIKETQKLPAMGNQGEWIVTQEPTCTEEGNQERICTVCGNEENQAIDMIPHTLGNWQVTKQATCTEEGEKIQTCTDCGVVCDTQAIEMTDHKLSSWQYNSTSHYNVCFSCKQSFNIEEHKGEETCTVCKYHYGDTIGLTYKIDNYTKGYIVSGIGTTDTEIIIPSTYYGKPVTGIGEKAFKNCRGLTSIIIPDSVTYIGNEAFYGCSGLTSVTIPDSVTSIGTEVFCGCGGLMSITIPDSVTYIGYYAFGGCSGLTSITIPDSDISIDSYAFSGCSSLTSIYYMGDIASWCKRGGRIMYYGAIQKKLYINGEELKGDLIIPDGVTSIGSYAFYGCSSLTSITIPDSVTSISAFAFEYCSSLMSVKIGNGVTSIGEEAFYNCRGLKSVYYKGVEEDWNNISIESKNEKLKGAKRYYYSEAEPTEEGKYWHYDSDGNVEVWELNTLSYKLSEDGTYYSVVDIGTYKSADLIIPETYKDLPVTKIKAAAFYDNETLTSVTIPSSIIEIGDDAFGCRNLRAVYINALQDWLNISFANMGANPLNIAHNLYINNTLINSLEISGISVIGDNAFTGFNGTKVTIGSGVKSIGKCAFAMCNKITDLTIGNNVEAIGTSAFADCRSLNKVVFPNSVKTIGYSAFAGCTELNNLQFGNGVVEILSYAFNECFALKNLYIPENIKFIGTFAFYNSGVNLVEFALTSGWYITKESEATSGTNIAVTDISQNAKYLSTDYYDYYWKRA